MAELLMSIAKDHWPDYVLVRERGMVRVFSKHGPPQLDALRDAMEAGAGKK